MIKMLTNVDSYSFKHKYPFQTTNFLVKVSNQQFDPRCIIHACNAISLATYVQRMSFATSVQSILLILKLGPPPKFARVTIRPNCEIGIIRDRLATTRILCIFFILVTMCYHTHRGNGQLSKPIYHFVAHMYPWKCNCCMVHLVMNNE
jgi:hypothetical protein